jgi:hypothetical protein
MVVVGGQPCTVTYAGMIAPGLDQINIELPNVTSGWVTIEATVNGVFSLPKNNLVVPFPLVSTPTATENGIAAAPQTVPATKAASPMEANRPRVMAPQRKCICSSQGCMAAQVIFHYRCEPTQVEIAITAGNHKSCFAVTILRCDFLHDIINGKCGKKAYTGGIACEKFAREGIDVVIRNGHCHTTYHA